MKTLRRRHMRPSGRASVCLATLIWAGLFCGPASAQDTAFEATHIERSGSVQFASPPEEVFPLLEPQGREKRAASWSVEYLYPRSGEGQPGAVMRQKDRRADVEQIWAVVEHDPPQRIKYVIFVPDMEVWEFDIQLSPTSSGGTTADVEHRITSLSAGANDDVQQFADAFDEYFEWWHGSISALLDADGPRANGGQSTTGTEREAETQSPAEVEADADAEMTAARAIARRDPLIKISVLPMEVDVPDVLAKLSADVAEVSGIPLEGITVTWETIPAGHLNWNGISGESFDSGEFPALVEVFLASFLGEEMIEKIMLTIAESLETHAGIPQRQVFEIVTVQEPGHVFTYGEIMRWDPPKESGRDD